jgi:phosphatidate phosphatase APP1
MVKRYFGEEFGGVKIRISVNGESVVARTNDNGIFLCRLPMKIKPDTKKNWHKIDFKLLDGIEEGHENATTIGNFFIVDETVDTGIISDIDDTFLVSHATNTLKKIRLMLFKNAHTRIPFKGVSAFYHALQKGSSGGDSNPIFYVSSSEWNLYDLILDFCLFHNIPVGSFLLRDSDISILKFWKSGGGSHDHKLDKIRLLMQFFPGLGFILIGDSGQKDPWIYAQIVQEYPDRIKVIYIRNVGILKKIRPIEKIVKEVAEHGVEMLLVEDTEEAAHHAISKGYISYTSVASIIKEKEKDKQTSDLSALGDRNQ